MVIMVFLLASLLGLSPETTNNCNGNLETVYVQVTEIRNTQGKICLEVYKDNESFKKENSYKHLEFSKSNVKGGKLLLKLQLPPGKWGIGLLDDENENGKMDFGLILPEEGFGFSNYYHTSMTSRPTLSDFDFEVKSGVENKVGIRVRYL